MEALRSIIDAVLVTGSSEIHWIDEYENKYLHSPPSYSEWMQAACGEFAASEEEAIAELRHKPDRTRADDVVLKVLSEKELSTRQCRFALRFSEVEKLAPP
jgi:hypothetical protein